MKRMVMVFGCGAMMLAAACTAPQDEEDVLPATSDLVKAADCVPQFRERTDRLERALTEFESAVDGDAELRTVYADAVRMSRGTLRPRLARVAATARTSVAPSKPYASYVNACADARKVAIDQVTPSYYEVKNTVNALIKRDMDAGNVRRGQRMRDIWNPPGARDGVFKAFQGGGNDFATLVSEAPGGAAGKVSFGGLSTPTTTVTRPDGAAPGCAAEFVARTDATWASLTAIEGVIASSGADGMYADAVAKVGDLKVALARVGAIAGVAVGAPWNGFVNPCFDAKASFARDVLPAYEALRNRMDQLVAADITLRRSERANAIQRVFRLDPTSVFRLMDADGAAGTFASFAGAVNAGAEPIVRFAP